MNAAFRRGEAFTRLENYSSVIVLYLTLISIFPDSPDQNHWRKELDAFKGVLRRYNSAKSKSGTNFTKEDIVRALSEEIDDAEKKDYLANDIIGTQKGLAIDSHAIDWMKLDGMIAAFAASVVAA